MFFVFLLLVLFANDSLCAANTHRLLLNALDVAGLRDALTFLESLGRNNTNYSVTIYLHKSSERLITKVDMAHQTSKFKSVSYGYYSAAPLVDRSRLRKVKQVEKVSFVLEAMLNVTSKMVEYDSSGSNKLLSLVFIGNNINFIPASGSFGDLWGTTLSEFDVLLLSKNRGLTSASDYHDLMAVGLQGKRAVFEWLKDFSKVYRHHADRKAFTILEPRPALLEASVRHHNTINLGFFAPDEVKRHGLTPVEEEQNGNDGGGGGNNSTSLRFEVVCRDASGEGGSRCILNEPLQWLRKFERKGIPKDYYSRVVGGHLKESEINDKLPHGMWDGSLRFFRAENDTTPRKFCWERDTTPEQESRAQAYVVFNSTYTRPYIHPKGNPPGKLKALMLTGMEASAQRLDQKLYLNIAKMVYCRRHGYKFLLSASNQFRPYFTKDTFESLDGQANGADYFQGFMSKVPMIVTALMQHPTYDWLVWTDDDVYINPGWMYLPLDAFLDQVPSNKTFVSANYRSAFSNIFAIRNNENGRRLALDWLAVAQSGYVECHGFDQAALQTLILLRIAGNMNNPFPFNHSCLFSVDGDTGCNMKGRWSCDFRFETSLYFAGYKTAMNSNFFELRLSSYTKGCANDLVPDFHVITETPTTPRLQAGHATRLTEIFSSGHWDGPLGGGNDKLRRGAINGWFTSHKAEFLFWQAYLDPLACHGMPDDTVPTCDLAASGRVSSLRPRTHHHNHASSRGSTLHQRQNFSQQQYHDIFSTLNTNELNAAFSSVVSLTDGYGFDLLKGEYCRVLSPAIIQHQQETTYMRDYPKLIQAGKGYSQEKWKKVYQDFSGGEGRAPCLGKWGKGTDCDHGQGPDGQKQKETIRPENEGEYIERSNYCETCVRLMRPQDGLFVIDCRLDGDIKTERTRNISQLQDPLDLRANIFIEKRKI